MLEIWPNIAILEIVKLEENVTDAAWSSKGIDEVGVFVIGLMLQYFSYYMPEVQAQATVGVLGGGLEGVAFTLPDDYSYGTVAKRYREVYLNGEFYDYQTEYKSSSWVHRNGVTESRGSSTQYYEGDMMMMPK